MDDDLIEGQPFRFAAELMNAPWALMPEALTIVASPVAGYSAALSIDPPL